jgi:hypothetical protein
MYLQNAQAMKKKDTKGSNSFKKNIREKLKADKFNMEL